jgi:hypothetical protein
MNKKLYRASATSAINKYLLSRIINNCKLQTDSSQHSASIDNATRGARLNFRRSMLVKSECFNQIMEQSKLDAERKKGGS